MPIRMTAVLEGALAGFLFIRASGPISLKKSRFQMSHLKPAMVAHVISRMPGGAFASESVRQNNGINHVYYTVAGIDIGYYYARIIDKNTFFTNADLNISTIYGRG